MLLLINLYTVFMSPESTQDKCWRKCFSDSSVFKQRLSILAVDEAHCILNGLGFNLIYDNTSFMRCTGGKISAQHFLILED